MHGKFKTRKLLTCLVPQHIIVIQCLNIVYVLNGHEKVQPRLRVLKELTDGPECNINDSQSDIVEELIHVQTDAILLNEGACKSGQSDQIINNGQNQNENMTQTEVQIESGPHSLRKNECTHCKNYIYIQMNYKLQKYLCMFMICTFYANYKILLFVINVLSNILL